MPRRWLCLPLLALLCGCPDDELFGIGQGDGSVDGDPSRLDTGVAGLPDATAALDAAPADATPADVAEDAGTPVLRPRIVWVRVPSSGAVLGPAAAGDHRLRVRLPPPTSHGAASSPEHQVGSVLSGRKQGGQR